MFSTPISRNQYLQAVRRVDGDLAFRFSPPTIQQFAGVTIQVEALWDYQLRSHRLCRWVDSKTEQPRGRCRPCVSKAPEEEKKKKETHTHTHTKQSQ